MSSIDGKSQLNNFEHQGFITQVNDAVDQKVGYCKDSKNWKQSKKLEPGSKKTDEITIVYFISHDKEHKKNLAPRSLVVHDFKHIKAKNSDSLSFISKDAKNFLRFVQMQAKIVDSEVQTTREIKSFEERWYLLKKAFHERLEMLKNQKAQSH